MDKELLKEIFEELLKDYEGCAFALNINSGDIEDQDDIVKEVEEYRKRFARALEDDE